MSFMRAMGSIFVLGAFSLLWACSSTPQPASGGTPTAQTAPPIAAPAVILPTYSEGEQARLGLCAGMSDNAFSVANRKRAGVPAEEVKKLYVGKPGIVGQLMPAMVDKIYSDKFEHEWDYTIAFFGECTQQMTPVPRERIGLASYCMQNRLIAAVAVAMRDSGQSKEAAYGKFAAFKADTPLRIVDDVYMHRGTLVEAENAAWDPCIKSNAKL